MPSGKLALVSAMAMAAVVMPKIDVSIYRGHHAGGSIHQMFDLGQIMRARRNNQRGKNQKRLRGMRGKH